MGTKGGVLSQKETARENKAFQTKSADALVSVDKNLKDLTKGIQGLNNNVQTIKVVEAAQLAHDIRTHLQNKANLVKAGEAAKANIKELRNVLKDETAEMSARNEAGLHDISRGITGLHSLLAGDTHGDAKNRLARVKENRGASLMKHRKIFAVQRDVLRKYGVGRVTDLHERGRKEYDKIVQKTAKKHGRKIPLPGVGPVTRDGVTYPGIGSIAGGLGGGGTGGGSIGGRNTPARAFAALLKNTDTTNLKLDEVIEILRGNRLLELENKKEGKSKKSRFGKTKGIALGGLAMLVGGVIGAVTAGAEAVAARKLAKELKAKNAASKAKKLAASQKAAELAKTKEQLAKKNLEAKKAAEAKVKADRIAKEKAANVQKAKEAKAAEKIKKTENMNAKKAKETGKIKAYLKKASVADLKSWLKNLRLVSTIGKAKGVLAWNPAGWAIIALLFVAEELAIGYVTNLVEAELAERAKKEKAEAKAKPKSKEFVVSAGGTIVPIGTDDQLGILNAAKQNLGAFNHRAAQTNQMLGKDWYTKPEHAKTYGQFQTELKKAVFDVRDAQADIAGNTSNVVNSGNTSTNTTIINYGNVGGNPAGNGL